MQKSKFSLKDCFENVNIKQRTNNNRITTLEHTSATVSVGGGLDMCLNGTKPVCWVSGKAKLKLVSSATETRWKNEISHVASLDVEDIYFFEVNTKYISSSVLKTSEFS